MERKTIDYFSTITKWLGTPASIVLHTLGFVGMFVLYLFNISLDRILLILTTVVSLEAIYLSLFIQLTVNRQTAHLKEIGADTDSLLEDVGELSDSAEDILEDTTQIVEDTEALTEDENAQRPS